MINKECETRIDKGISRIILIGVSTFILSYLYCIGTIFAQVDTYSLYRIKQDFQTNETAAIIDSGKSLNIKGNFLNLTQIDALPLPMRNRGVEWKSLVSGEGEEKSAIGTDGTEFRAFGEWDFLRIPYTITRVQQGGRSVAADPENLDHTTYPYRAVGRLFFRKPNGASSWCTATVIKRGVIVTAAHCVQKFGAGMETNSRFEFFPGYYGADSGPVENAAHVMPYGSWTARVVIRPASWRDGSEPNCSNPIDGEQVYYAGQNDIALLALSKNENGSLIGDVVGKIPYRTQNYGFTDILFDVDSRYRAASITALGYPEYSDQGKIMQRVDGIAVENSYNDTNDCTKEIDLLTIGSPFTGGSSGGPWIVNFLTRAPNLSGGLVRGSDSAIAVVGVTSFGSGNGNVSKYLYSPQFATNSTFPGSSYGLYGAGNIGALMYTLCNYKPVGDTQTFSEQGYCN